MTGSSALLVRLVAQRLYLCGAWNFPQEPECTCHGSHRLVLYDLQFIETCVGTTAPDERRVCDHGSEDGEVNSLFVVLIKRYN